MEQTDAYIRDYGTIACDGEKDEDYPTEIYLFWEEDYDVKVNGNDGIHGKQLLIRRRFSNRKRQVLCRRQLKCE